MLENKILQNKQRTQKLTSLVNQKKEVVFSVINGLKHLAKKLQSDGDATPDETKKTPVKGKTKKAKVKVTVKVERSVVPTTTGVNPEVHTYFLLLSCQTRKL